MPIAQHHMIAARQQNLPRATLSGTPSRSQEGVTLGLFAKRLVLKARMVFGQ
jgi:hypothetical protein